MKRQKKELYPTLKVEAKSEDDLSVQFEEADFKDVIFEITQVTDVSTAYGEKPVLTLQTGDKIYQVFVNAQSMSNLIDAFGDDDKKWKGESVTISKQRDKKYNKEMLVVSKA